MTTREEVIAAAKDDKTETIKDRFYVARVASGCAIRRSDISSKKGDMLFAQFTDNTMRDSEVDANIVCRLLNGAASREAEIAELKQEHINCALSLDECEQECEWLRAELAEKTVESNRRLDLMNTLDAELEASRKREAAAIAACKTKDEALQNCEGMLDELRDYPVTHDAIIEALTIQPDDAALKAWLGEPVACMTYKGYLLHAADPRRFEHSDPELLYSPKGLK